jgi:hypothetical protein
LTSDATAAEIARLGVLQAVDNLMAAALVELFVTPTPSDQPASRQPARQLVAVARHLQEALTTDAQTGGTAGLDELFDRLNREEKP